MLNLPATVTVTAVPPASLVSSLTSSASRPSGKPLLALLRDLSVYAVPGPVELSPALLQAVAQIAQSMHLDRDVERKICRLCVHLLLEQRRIAEPPVPFVTFVSLEAKKSPASMRQAFFIKTLGRIGGEEAHNTIAQLLLCSSYPVRRKVMLAVLGQKKADHEYEAALEMWSSMLLGLRHIGQPLGRDFDEALLTAAQSENGVLARHSLALLSAEAPSEELASRLLARMRSFNLKGDPLGSVYLIQAAGRLAGSDDVPLHVAAELWDALYSLLSERANTESVEGAKLCADLLTALCDCPRSWALLTELLRRSYLDLLSQLMQAAARLANGLEASSVALPVVMRSLARLGKFLQSRPPSLSRTSNMSLEEDSRALVSGALARLDATLSSSYAALHQTVDGHPLPRGRSSSTASTSTVNADAPLSLSLSPPSPSFARPHSYCDLLVAVMWLLPDNHDEGWDAVGAHLDLVPVRLGEVLSLRLLEQLCVRAKVGHQSSTLAFGLAQRLLRVFGSEKCCQALVNLWVWLSKEVFADPSAAPLARRLQAKQLLCTSALQIIDEQHVGQFTAAKKDVWARAHWVLAQHVLACLPMPMPQGCPDALLRRVLHKLLLSATVESGAARALSEAGLVLLVLRLHVYTRLSGSEQYTAMLRFLASRLRDGLARATNHDEDESLHSGLVPTHSVRWTFHALERLSKLQQAGSSNEDQLLALERSVCLPVDGSWDAWRRSLQSDPDGEGDAERERAELNLSYSAAHNERRALELPAFADVFTYHHQEHRDQEELPPPPPTSAAPLFPPKPIKDATPSLTPYALPTAAPPSPPKPARATGGFSTSDQSAVAEVFASSLPTFAFHPSASELVLPTLLVLPPPASPEPRPLGSDPFDAFAGLTPRPDMPAPERLLNMSTPPASVQTFAQVSDLFSLPAAISPNPAFPIAAPAAKGVSTAKGGLLAPPPAASRSNRKK